MEKNIANKSKLGLNQSTYSSLNPRSVDRVKTNRSLLLEILVNNQRDFFESVFFPNFSIYDSFAPDAS